MITEEGRENKKKKRRLPYSTTIFDFRNAPDKQTSKHKKQNTLMTSSRCTELLALVF